MKYLYALLVAGLGMVIVIAVLAILVLLLTAFNKGLEPSLQFFGNVKTKAVNGIKNIFKKNKTSAVRQIDIVDIKNPDEEIAAVMAAINVVLESERVNRNLPGLDFVVKSISKK